MSILICDLLVTNFQSDFGFLTPQVGSQYHFFSLQNEHCCSFISNFTMFQIVGAFSAVGKLHEQNCWFRILNLVWNFRNTSGSEIVVVYKYPPFSKHERHVLDNFVFFSSLNGTIKNRSVKKAGVAFV